MVEQMENGRAVRLAASCTECQRRKQKCSREWPCNHCQTRRIAHLCKFAPKKVLRSNKTAINDSRPVVVSHEVGINPGQKNWADVATSSGEHEKDFKILGYLPKVQLDEGYSSGNSIAVSHTPRGPYSREMENALRVIPPKSFTDILIQNYVEGINSQYYCLYPPMFLHDYSAWWSGKVNGQTLTPEFTALLLRTCACSLLFLDMGPRQKLELELGENVQTLSERYHHATKQLSNTISPGEGGLTQIQQLFLTATWFKAQAMFVESWHALSAAIHEAQELGMHRSSVKTGISEFHIEMRRRLWCILYSWDWQMSLMLSRPFIINSAYCSVEMPNLQLETTDTQTDMPSPILPIALQCQLGQALVNIPGVVGGIMTPSQAIAVQQETEKWLAAFPPAFQLINPDTRWDNDYDYVKVQRIQLHTIAYLIMLMPLKQCLTKIVDGESASIEKSLQPTAVDLALKLIEASRRLLDCMKPSNTNPHFAPFAMFDTAASLCSAIIHDRNRSLPQREKILRAIAMALDILENISHNTKTAAICFAILTKLVSNIALSPEEQTEHKNLYPKKIDDSAEVSKTSESRLASENGLSTINNLPQPDQFHIGIHASPTSNYPSLEGLVPSSSDLTHLFSVDLGELGQIWDFENLGLDFNNGIPA